MKRRFVVASKNANKPVKAAKYDGVKITSVKALQRKLQAAYDYLEMMDDVSYNAVGGDFFRNDLDTMIRECQEVANQIDGGY